MLTPRLAFVSKVAKRNFGMVAPALQKATDPIQQLFLDKVREYKSRSAGGKLVDVTPEVEKERKAELEKIAKQFGGVSSAEMNEFPKFTFQDPTVEVGSETK